MSIVLTSRQEILIAHVCSKCGEALIHKCPLYTDGRANAFLHERDKAEHAREMAYQQAMKDIAMCYESPRQLGSMTEVETGENREWAFYQIEGLDKPCSCGHVEPWQLRKKSIWNPTEGPFRFRPLIPDVPQESRPFLLDSQEAVAAWLEDPANPANIEKSSVGAQMTAEEKKAEAEETYWTCYKCQTRNRERIGTCQGCGMSKQWSEAKAAKKK